MEDYLAHLYEKDGIKIFREDYNLWEKLLNKYERGSLRADAYHVKPLLDGNAFYNSIVEARKDNNEISQTVYNAFIGQIYTPKHFWEDENIKPQRLEELIRMFYRVAGISIEGIPMTIVSEESEINDRKALQNEWNNAQTAYKNESYKTAFVKSEVLFHNGVGSAASLLSKAYYYGNGTYKDYNKALFYLTYPHSKNRAEEKEERAMLDTLLDLRDKSKYSAILCMVGSLIVFLLMLLSGFYGRNLAFAIFNTVLLVAGDALFVMTCKKKLIFDFSYWFLILGCMLLIILIL